MTSPRPELQWTEDNHAYENRSHYHAYEVPNDPSDRKWRLELFGMFTDEPGQTEEKLSEFYHHTLTEAKDMAQGLAQGVADQRGTSR